MTASIDLLTDAFGRVRGTVTRVLANADAALLSFRVDGEANTVAWLVWHLTRVQDDHIAEVAGTGQIWIDGGWAHRFDLPFSVDATGYGQSAEDVEALADVSAELLLGYHEAVADRTAAYLQTLTDDDLARVVDRRWNPPVTLGVRLVSVVDDDLEHAGQAAFVRGVAERASL